MVISYRFEKKYVRFPNQRTTQTEETRIPGSASRPLPGSRPERNQWRRHGYVRNRVRIPTGSLSKPWYMGLVCLLFLGACVCLLFLTEEIRPLQRKPAHLCFQFGGGSFQPIVLVSDLVQRYQFWCLDPVRRRRHIFPANRQSLPERWREGRLQATPLIAATVAAPPSSTCWTIHVPDVRRGVTHRGGAVVTLGDALLRPDRS